MGNDWIEHLEAGDSSSAGATERDMPTSPLRHPLLFSSSASSASPASTSSSSPTTTSPPARLVCARCRCDLTLLSDVVWEGVMGERSEPALLTRSVVNAAPSTPSVRRGIRLSSGSYDLADVECRRCREPLGWRYLRHACGAGEKFKVGCTLLAAARLDRVVGFDDGGEDEGQRQQGQQQQGQRVQQ